MIHWPGDIVFGTCKINHTRTGKYCSEGYLDMCRCVGLGSEGFVAQHLTQYMKWKLEIEGEKWGEIKLNN